MGCYINPKNQTKEQWLNENGVLINKTPNWEDRRDDTLPVCLVNNGMFTAAGIAFSKNELSAFNQPEDLRPKKWYEVEVGKLLEVEPSLVHYIKPNK